MAARLGRRSLALSLGICVLSVLFTQCLPRILAQSTGEASAEEKLAVRLVAAKSDEERQSLLAAEKDLVSLLHLATHGVLNDSNPDVFASPTTIKPAQYGN